MRLIVGVVAAALLLVVLVDAFETIVLPRRVTREFRLTRYIYRLSWVPWSAAARRLRAGSRREAFLGFFGPLSLLILLSIWAISLVAGFGLLQWALGSHLATRGGNPTLTTDLYFSGTTFITLGLGDVAPVGPAAHLLTVMEASVGFGFLALVIGYLPVIYQSFSRREVHIALLDARAGSPPTAGELLVRAARRGNPAQLQQFLADWEEWSADLLESHLSYPVLAYYRSQHENQSWLAALTMILDACALVLVGVDGIHPGQAQLTFAMARHAAVDLTQVLGARPLPAEPPRLHDDDWHRLQATLAAAGIPLGEASETERAFTALRSLYEPYVEALAARLLFRLPDWLPRLEPHDDWTVSAWEWVWSIPLPDADREVEPGQARGR